MTKEEIELSEKELDKYLAMCKEFPDNLEYKETLKSLTETLRREYENENQSELRADKERIANAKAADDARQPFELKFESMRVDDLGAEEKAELNELAARFRVDDTPENRFNLSSFIGRISMNNESAEDNADIAMPKNVLQFPTRCKS